MWHFLQLNTLLCITKPICYRHGRLESQKVAFHPWREIAIYVIAIKDNELILIPPLRVGSMWSHSGPSTNSRHRYLGIFYLLSINKHYKAFNGIVDHLIPTNIFHFNDMTTMSTKKETESDDRI